jgi:hypothetical protein
MLESAALYPLLQVASRWFAADPGIWAELRQWTRLSRRHPDYRRDGLTDVALGLSKPEAWGFSAALRRTGPRSRPWGLRAAVAQGQAKAFRAAGPVVALLVPAATDEAGEVAYGRLVARLWLILTRYGLAAHPQSQLLDCPDTAGLLAERAGAQDEHVLWVARVGRPDPGLAEGVPFSARRVGEGASVTG